MHTNHRKDLKRIARDLPRLRRRMQVGGTRERLQEAGATVLAEAELHRAALRSVKESVQAQYVHVFERWYSRRPETDRPYALHYETVGAHWMRIGGYALIALEALLTAWLSMMFLVLPGWAAVTVGVSVAILLTLGAKGVKAFLIARHADTPLEARDLFVRWIIVAAVIEAILVVLLLYVRGSTDPLAARVTIAFGAISALISFNTMWLAGAMLACAELYSFSSQLAALWERADHLEGELAVIERTTKWRLEWLRTGVESTSRATPEAGTRRMLPAVRATVIGLAFSALGATGGAAQELSCRVWLDGSTSPVAEELTVTARELVRTAPQVSARRCGGKWQVLVFSDDAWSVVPRTVITWPVTTNPSCAVPRLNEAESIFLNARARRLAEARRACDSLRAATVRRAEAATARASARLSTALMSPPARRGTCTAIRDLLERIAATSAPGVDIISSDMVETCQPSLTAVAPPRAGTVIVALLSRASANPGARASDFARRRDETLGAAPWLQIVPPWGLGGALIRNADTPTGALRRNR